MKQQQKKGLPNKHAFIKLRDTIAFDTQLTGYICPN